MGRILIGGPHGKVKDRHDDLAIKLLQENHIITYIKNDQGSMFWELAKTPLVPWERRYNLVLYDTDLFYTGTSAEKKMEWFEIEKVYLTKTKVPVIILAETELAARLRPLVEKADFMQIDQPYQSDDLVRKINEIVGVK